MNAAGGMQRRFAAWPTLGALFALLLATVPWAQAQQRNPLQTIGETVAERTSPHYRFERFVVTSSDGDRRWRINLGIPRGPAPAAGFPALWMLDGNAALMEFDAPLLEALAGSPQPPLLVFVGYDNALRIDSPARTRDYTPLADPDAGDDAPRGGGADAFLDMLERQVRPEVARRAPLDAHRQTLWGHSLGGLFTLHALYTRSGAFQTYVPASPSLWWAQGALLDGPEQRFVDNNAGHPARVLLMLGGGERSPDFSGRDMNNPRVVAHLRRISGAPPDAAWQLSQRLRQVPGLSVEYHPFPGLGHGPMLRASLMRTLHVLAGVPDRSGDRAP
ncbi:alpha/beta hydrolase [Stenotrophomonas mori]|uniref:Alpha/beta hydrolase n=1 Tax=Stenotrophomonas mori TaxID=2871096 RepID=A0ABT0SIZ4_9GAMM|nr:alpha/beta hydrolase-fold protein [Stenotrophomonas mori]MCL7714965.1 alpha/beta hydrolase [Stenotrophomonas mori]